MVLFGLDITEHIHENFSADSMQNLGNSICPAFCVLSISSEFVWPGIFIGVEEYSWKQVVQFETRLDNILDLVLVSTNFLRFQKNSCVAIGYE